MRARYQHLMAHPEEVEAALQAGAAKARAQATPFMHTLRRAVGLASLDMTVSTLPDKPAPAATALPQFKQYREADGLFYFKLTGAGGRVLLQSHSFIAPRKAGQAVRRLQTEGAAALSSLHASLEPVEDEAALLQALAALQAAAK